MRTITAALQSLLSSKNPFWVADLFTVTLTGGAVYRWTSADQPVISNGNIYTTQAPYLQRTKWAQKNTVEVPEMEIRLLSLDNDFNGGQNIKTLLHNGAFDGARVRLERAYMPSFGDTSAGTMLLFEGRQSAATIGALGAILTIKPDNVLMNQYMPRNIYQNGCIHTLYDSGCTLLRAGFTISGNVGAAPSTSFIPWASAPATPSLYSLGYITVTSGAAIGQVRTIKQATASGITLTYPLYSVPAPGDTFAVTQGCDKTLATCTNTFANQANFLGMPFIPDPEIAL